jgi:hypothetical protein
MDIYELEMWLDKEYDNNLFRKDIIENLFNSILLKVKNSGLIIKNEDKFYKDFLLYLIKYSN